MDYPYTFTSCPCVDVSSPTIGVSSGDDEPHKRPVDPRAPRTSFSLYPIEHLLYCEDCQQIRCPRCTIEEILCWYCPNCLFEMPTTVVKSEGGRCNRNCFNCPVCIAPLATTSINFNTSSRAAQGPWILSCQHCHWSTLDIGWQFEKPGSIQNQMAKLDTDGNSQVSNDSDSSDMGRSAIRRSDENPVIRFSSLRNFFSSQLSATNNASSLLTPSGGYNYSSPSSLARIMSLYTGRGIYGKKEGGNPTQIRESAELSEGLRLSGFDSDHYTIQRLRDKGWTKINAVCQRGEQQHSPRFADDLWPAQVYLRTKRSKRCRICRHILVKPETKVQSTRFKIKLVANNYLPTISLKPLQPALLTQLPKLDLKALPTDEPFQILLSLSNPRFESVRITLATAARTPGRRNHKVTLLCPQFSIGPNVDQWDEALGSGKDRRSSRIFNASNLDYVGGDSGKTAEAGKVWERGRNWTTIVVEIVCSSSSDMEDNAEEDDDILEIPVYVRMEWVADSAADAVRETPKSDDRKESRELAYWVVMVVGRIIGPGGKKEDFA